MTERLRARPTRATAACQVEKKEWVMFLFPDFLPVDGSSLAFVPDLASHPFMGPTPPSLPSLAETFQFWSRLASLWRSVLGVPPS